MSLYRELKRRNVFRAGVLYIVASWLVLQIADVAISLLALPEWTGRLVFLIVALGFVPALVFSWLYELTPEGLKREHEVPRTASVTARTGRKIDTLIGVFGALVVCLIIVDRLVSVDPGGPDKSIAVLPFANLSGDPDQEFFSDGLSEELLDLLAKIPELKVISRTSSFQFKGRNEDVRVIAGKLGVATVLEGSVRRSGERLRVTAQLIDGVDGSHLWSETYDRDLDDLFVLQDDIAGAVVRQLRIELLGERLPTVIRPRNKDAHTLYLRGRHLSDLRSAESLEQAVANFKQALEIEPDYAPAWVALSVAYFRQANFGYVPRDNMAALAREAAQRAIELNPLLPEAYLALSYIARFEDWDWAAAEAALDRARALGPDDPGVLLYTASYASFRGRYDEAIGLFHESLQVDPLRTATYNNLALTYLRAGRWAEGEQRARQLLEINPNMPTARSLLSEALLWQGKLPEALEVSSTDPDVEARLFGLAMVHHALGNREESDSALEELAEKYGDSSAYNIAGLYAWRGESDPAFAWLDRAYAQRDYGMPGIATEPLFANLHGDPRYAAILEKMNLAE